MTRIKKITYNTIQYLEGMLFLAVTIGAYIAFIWIIAVLFNLNDLKP